VFLLIYSTSYEIIVLCTLHRYACGHSLQVLDEADRMLDMGFEPQIREIVSRIRVSYVKVLDLY